MIQDRRGSDIIQIDDGFRGRPWELFLPVHIIITGVFVLPEQEKVNLWPRPPDPEGGWVSTGWDREPVNRDPHGGWVIEAGSISVLGEDQAWELIQKTGTVPKQKEESIVTQHLDSTVVVR